MSCHSSEGWNDRHHYVELTLINIHISQNFISDILTQQVVLAVGIPENLFPSINGKTGIGGNLVGTLEADDNPVGRAFCAPQQNN